MTKIHVMLITSRIGFNTRYAGTFAEAISWWERNLNSGSLMSLQKVDGGFIIVNPNGIVSMEEVE